MQDEIANKILSLLEKVMDQNVKLLQSIHVLIESSPKANRRKQKMIFDIIQSAEIDVINPGLTEDENKVYDAIIKDKEMSTRISDPIVCARDIVSVTPSGIDPVQAFRRVAASYHALGRYPENAYPYVIDKIQKLTPYIPVLDRRIEQASDAVTVKKGD